LTWNEGPGANVDSDGISAQFRLLESQPGKPLRRVGDVDRALAAGPHRVDAVYELPLLAHVSMEPMNCTAHVQGAKCDVWGPIQLPAQAQEMVAKATGLQKEAIAIHPTRIGGSFGRRLASDFAAEAAYVAKAVDRPVQVVWTREDDVRCDFYRPAAYHHVRAAVTDDGNVTAWRHHIVTLPNSMYPQANGTEGLLAPRSNNLKADLSDGFRPCLIPSFELFLSTARIPVQTGSLRAPENNANAFVIQSMIDELAHASRVDPLELQIRLLGSASDFPYPGRYSSGLYNPDRLKAVLSLAAASAGWGSKLSSRRGRGIAAHYTNNSYAAYVIEVEVDPVGTERDPVRPERDPVRPERSRRTRRLEIRRVVVAIDCGTPVNRSGIEAQAQGGTLDALSAALFGEITLARGRSVQDNFTNYRWLRNHEAPAIEIHLVESREAPTGLGEIPYPPVAPALTNAIFSATGERIRRLPLSSHGFTLAT
jgi:isoquinoline 1-oxidoreductase beta subunit